MKITIKYKQLSLSLILFFAAFQSYSQIEFEEIVDEKDWIAAVNKADSSGKFLFLDIYATWCGPCKYLEKNVYTDEKLGEFYNENFINLKMDGETEFGSKMARELQLRGYPTMYYIDKEENVMTSLVGVREAGPLAAIGKTVVNNAGRLAYYEESFDTGELDSDELKEYQGILNTLEQEEKARIVASKLLPMLTVEELLSEDYKDIVIKSPGGLDSKLFSIISDNIQKVKENWTKEELRTYYEGVFNQTLIRAINNQDEEILNRIIEELLPVYMAENPENIDQGVFVTRKLYFANTGNWARYDTIVMKEFERTGKDDRFLYMNAYEVANEYNQSSDAIDLAVKWMKMAEEINPSFENLILTTYLYALKGQGETAKEYIERMKNMELSEDQKSVLDELESRVNQFNKG